MAWATKCDRCGAYYEYHEETNGFAFICYDRADVSYQTSAGDYDLCPQCVKSLYDWFCFIDQHPEVISSHAEN